MEAVHLVHIQHWRGLLGDQGICSICLAHATPDRREEARRQVQGESATADVAEHTTLTLAISQVSHGKTSA